MPIVNKQKAVTKPAPLPSITTDRSVSGRIAKVKESVVGHMKMSIYGDPKTGKTRFACTFPKPLLIIGAEDGTASVAGMKGVEFVQLYKADEVLELARGDILQQRWKTVVIDTATKLRDLLVAESVMGVDEKTGIVNMPASRPSAKLYKDAYMNAASEMKTILRSILDLPRVIPLNVVIIAQEANLTAEESAQIGQSEIIKPKIASAVGKSVSDYINAECDYIAQTLIREGVEEQEVQIPAVGNQPAGVVKQLVRTGKKEYAMRVGPHDMYKTGFRLPNGRTLSQEFIVDPTYDKIVQLIEGADEV